MIITMVEYSESNCCNGGDWEPESVSLAVYGNLEGVVDAVSYLDKNPEVIILVDGVIGVDTSAIDNLDFDPATQMGPELFKAREIAREILSRAIPIREARIEEEIRYSEEEAKKKAEETALADISVKTAKLRELAIELGVKLPEDL